MIQREQFKDCFGRLTRQQQAEFLTVLAHSLTICGREACPHEDSTVSCDEALAVLRVANEIQHRITAHLGALLTESQDRYLDDVFCDILFDTATGSEIANRWGWAIERSVASSAAWGKRE